MTDRNKIKRAVERADGDLEPSMERLMAAVPDLVGEARRRRAAAAAEPTDLLGALVPLAWKAIPRLGAAAAVLLIVSSVLFFTAAESTTVADADTSYEQLILTGTAADGVDDPLFEAITTREDG